MPVSERGLNNRYLKDRTSAEDDDDALLELIVGGRET